MRIPMLCTASLCLTTGCFGVSGDIPEACLHQTELTVDGLADRPEFPGLPAGMTIEEVEANPPINPNTGRPLNEGAIERVFVHDDMGELADMLGSEDTEAEMFLLSTTLSARSGVDDFAFIERIRLLLDSADASSGLESTTVVDCDRDEGCAPSGASAQLSGDTTTSLVEYIRSGSVQFQLELEGRLPLQSWSVDVDVCMQGKVAYGGGL